MTQVLAVDIILWAYVIAIGAAIYYLIAVPYVIYKFHKELPEKRRKIHTQVYKIDEWRNKK